MSSNSSGFVHKVFFTSNRAFAELCAAGIRSAHPGLCPEIHYGFEPYVSRVHKQITDTDLIRIDYFFTDDVVMALPALDEIGNIHLNFLVSEGIDGVAFDLMQYSTGLPPDSHGYARPCRIVSSGLYKGCHVRRNRSRFRRTLVSRVQALNIVKSFIPKVHNSFSLSSLLDACFRKLQVALNATGGLLLLEEKKGGRTIFLRKYGEVPPEGPEILRDAGPPPAQVCSSVESSHARGYFQVCTERPLSACGNMLVKVFREQMCLFIDNTITTQERLKRHNLNLSLVEPDTANVEPAARPASSAPGPDRRMTGPFTVGRAVAEDEAQRCHIENKFSHIEHLAWLGECVSEFAHEIRNPVTGISSSAQLLYEASDIGGEHKAVIEEILLGSRILEDVVKKYLNLAKPPDPRREECCLNTLLEQVCSGMRSKIASQRVTMEFNPGDELPKIYVDPGQVRQVFSHLLANALEAMPAGGKLAIETFLKDVGDDSKRSPRPSVISIISDSGMGINPEDRERVFDPFYTTKHSGAGLGLYTSYRILRNHNAEIYLLSEAGRGTAVTIGFPVSSCP